MKDKKRKKSKGKKKKHSSVMCEPQVEKQESLFSNLWKKYQIWLRT